MVIDDYWTMLAAALCNVSCALVGCLLMLRRLSLIGDAISHAVLPAIVLTYLFGGGLNPLVLFLSVAASGALVAWLTERLKSVGRVAEDASLGIVFTTLFALGVLLVNRLARQVDLDPGCVLFGSLELTTFDRVELFVPGLGWALQLPSRVVHLGYATIAVVAMLLLFWKEWKIAAFDPELLATTGFSPKVLYYFLASLTAGVVASTFESVGSILVIAMLVLPPATARILTDSYLGVFLWSAVLGLAAAILGHLLALSVNLNEAGAMSVVAGGLFIGALLFTPRRGLFGLDVPPARLKLQVARQDVLARLFRIEERAEIELAAAEATEYRPAKGKWDSWAAWTLLRTGELEESPAGRRLTGRGRRQAQSLVRAHRLWEAYMEKHFALPSDHYHEPAHRLEHFLNAELQRTLDEELEGPKVDPHGRDIPMPPTPRSDR